ncbi:MAG: DUF3822 family protein [Saprospiraceae bacterium]
MSESRKLDYWNRTALHAETANAHTLCAVIGPESVLIWAIDAQRGIHAAYADDFEAQDDNLRRSLALCPLLSLPFARRKLAFAHPTLTLVPRRLYRSEAQAQYFKLLLPEGDYVYHARPVPEQEAYLLWAGAPAFEHIVSLYFDETPATHIASPLIRTLSGYARDRAHTVAAHFRSRQATLAVFERENLLFYNSFFFNEPADALYFILLAYDQFKLDPEVQGLTLSGGITADSAIWRQLARYIRQIRFVTLPEGYILPDALRSWPPHLFYELSALNECSDIS